MTMLKLFKGGAKAQGLFEFSTICVVENHQKFVEFISDSLATNDPHTVISILEKVGKMQLRQTEIQSVSMRLCHFHDEELEAHNWMMIKYLMGKQKINLVESCG